jgi:hypothetical protein
MTLKRPPLAVVMLAILIIALAETGGAAMSQLRPQIERYARARVAALPQAHGLAGSAEYDIEVTSRAVFTAEAGLSFFHTHGEGMGLVLLFTATLVSTVVPGRRLRGALHALVSIGALFPLGFLAYALLVLEMGRDAGIEIAERYVLTPLGSAAILGLVGLIATLASGRARPA